MPTDPATHNAFRRGRKAGRYSERRQIVEFIERRIQFAERNGDDPPTVAELLEALKAGQPR